MSLRLNPWPAALGMGLNTGVILMNLSQLRKQSCSIRTLPAPAWLKDVLNAVLRRQSDLLYPLPCKWNVQMTDNSLSDTLSMAKLPMSFTLTAL